MKSLLASIFIYCPFILLIGSCSAYRTAPWYNNAELVNVILDSSIEIYHRKADIPQIAKRVFETTFPEDKKLADSGDFFNEFDMHMKHISNRRLIMGGKDSLGRYGYVVYETGGNIAYPTVIVYYSKDGRKINEAQMINLKDNVMGLEDLKNAIKNSRYTLSKGIGQ